MKKIELEELKQIELQILIELDRICRENKITYYLDGGTLIGAVRHKGFIPWDDDIDVCMPRCDYEKFKIIIRDNYKYKLLDEDEPDYYYSFGKLVDNRTVLIEHDSIYHPRNLGVNIDIFPLDGMPEDSYELDKHYDDIQLQKKILILCGSKGVKFRKNILLWWKDFALWWPNRKLNMDELKYKFRCTVQKYDFNNSSMIISGGSVYGRKDIIPKKFFRGTTELEFGGHSFYTMSGYDGYLTHYYNDYMQLPPIEKQKSHHHFTAYWKETN